MRWMNFFAFCLLVPALAGAQDTSAIQQPPGACGPLKARFHVTLNSGQPKISPLEPNSARVYVIEELLEGLGAGPIVRVGMDGQWVGASQGNSWTTFTVPAGEHHLCVDWQPGLFHPGVSLSLYGFSVEPDHTYYFHVHPPVGKDSYATHLEPLNEDEAQYLLSQYPQAISVVKK